MTFRVHHEDRLEWRRIGDISPPEMRAHIDASEQDGHLAFHERGSDATPQLMEMRLVPDTLIAPHAHDDAEIFYVVEGSLHWCGHNLAAGGSIFIPADTGYSFRAGPEGARLLNIRSRSDISFRPADTRPA